MKKDINTSTLEEAQQILKDHFAELALYDLWANKVIAHVVMDLHNFNEKLYRIISHQALAKHIWLDRLSGINTSGRSPWPSSVTELNQDDIVTAINNLAMADARLIAFVESCSLASTIHYMTSTGQELSNTITEILTHIINHATYHRGQLATLIKELGGPTPVTDFIVWIRSGRPNM